jgi:hypothetical protein
MLATILMSASFLSLSIADDYWVGSLGGLYEQMSAAAF